MKIIEWVKNQREGSINPKVDRERSVYPFLSNSGYANIASNGKFDSVLLMPSSKRFILEGLLVNNSQEANYFVLYDGQSGSVGLVTLPPIQIAQSKTDVITGLNIPFQSGVYASTGTSGITVRVWGMLIASEQV